MAKKIKKILAIDAETSGINFSSIDPSQNYQSVSWGMIVSDPVTFEPIDKLYIEIKPNGEDKWTKEAERVHGLTPDYLEENGIDEIEAAEKIGEFLIEHFGSKTITLLGHNVATFDIFFLKRLIKKYDMEFKFSNRCLDTFSLSMGTIGCQESDELFNVITGGKRKAHNSLEDAELALLTFKTISNIWDKHIG